MTKKHCKLNSRLHLPPTSSVADDTFAAATVDSFFVVFVVSSSSSSSSSFSFISYDSISKVVPYNNYYFTFRFLLRVFDA